ncbi:uncharacterized protein ACA1_252840 [Acanthamoeba castellanii str. Neff]|uniref:Uncharacterized protein n=1 Tax=Acanthamoeba castellanii (strain ATCC 30010 / Neff) TaxID=1257118 RepID=L8HC49_ACACF|nr:uncharacterized protein ACA1_252840 [Acanthamoeba castellanii str. Neff]ELR22328.1 hypothetical protein ACA1_252840 [Acanthamoeba castellanii str. Neff]
MAETESTTPDTGPPLPLVELCLRSVEGLVLHRPQELPAVAACLGVLPRSSVSQFVESLLLKSMTGLYPLPRFESFFWKWGNLRGRVCAEGCPSKVPVPFRMRDQVAQKLMKRKRGTSIGPDLAWCERDDLTRCFNCGCTIWDMGEYRKGMTNDEVDDVESGAFGNFNFLFIHYLLLCLRPRLPRVWSAYVQALSCALLVLWQEARLRALPSTSALADEVGLCWDCQDQDRA